MPFSRGLFVYGDPIEVPAGASADEMEAARQRVEASLEEVSARAERDA